MLRAVVTHSGGSLVEVTLLVPSAEEGEEHSFDPNECKFKPEEGATIYVDVKDVELKEGEVLKEGEEKKQELTFIVKPPEKKPETVESGNGKGEEAPTPPAEESKEKKKKDD